MGRAWHHLDGLVRFSQRVEDIGGYIVGILKPSTTKPHTYVNEGLALDVELLDRVFHFHENYSS